MYKTLVPCPACSRHVRIGTETVCPFCAASLPPGLAARAVPSVSERLSRNALFVFAATVGVGAGCASAVAPLQDDAEALAADARSPTSDGAPAIADVIVTDVVSGPDDHGGSMADYGGPPLRDAGH